MYNIYGQLWMEEQLIRLEKGAANLIANVMVLKYNQFD